jgi:hypothetical protein
MNPGQEIEQNGFCFARNLIALEQIERLENLIVRRARIDLDALGVPSEGLAPFELLRALEGASRQRFYKLCSIGSGLAGLQIATGPVVAQLIGDAFGIDASEVFPFPPAIFFNDRPVTRLQYRWHQESSYLQAYKNFLTIWFPLFRDLAPEDGPMIVARGSHREIYPYSASKEPNGVTQFAVSDEVAARFDQVPCAIGRGDAVVFHRDMLHKTGENTSGEPRVSVVVRYFNVLETPEFQPMLVPQNITNHDAVAAQGLGRQ